MKKFIVIRDRAIVLAVRATIQLRSCPVRRRLRLRTVAVIDICMVLKFITVEQFYFEHAADHWAKLADFFLSIVNDIL